MLRCPLNDELKMMWKAAIVPHTTLLTHYSLRATEKNKKNPVSQEVSVPGQDKIVDTLGHYSGSSTNPSNTAHALSAVSAQQNEGLPAWRCNPRRHIADSWSSYKLSNRYIRRRVTPTSNPQSVLCLRTSWYCFLSKALTVGSLKGLGISRTLVLIPHWIPCLLFLLVVTDWPISTTLSALHTRDSQ
jgi:hypothetical protein